MANIAIIPPTAFAAGTEVDDTSNTAVTEGAGGYSGRESVRQLPLRNFHLTVGPSDVAEVRAIFSTHRRKWPVLIRDWAGYTFNNQAQVLDADLSSGGINRFKTQRQIQPSTGTRFLTHRVLAVDESEQTAILKNNGVTIARGLWTFDDFAVIAAPAASTGGTVTLSFMELTAACFVMDQLTYKVLSIGSDGPIMSIQDCQLREIFEEELTDLMAQTDDSV